MIENTNDRIEQDLHQIADMLLLNGTLNICPGLLHGKIGIAIFFFHYAQYANNTLFMDYALELILEVQKQLHINNPVDYERGIAGIGVGISYLIQNKLIEVESDIFEDLDQRMYRAVMHDPWFDLSLYDGVAGYGCYWIFRLSQHPFSVQAHECLIYIAEFIEKRISDISTKEQVDVYRFLYDLHKMSIDNISTESLRQLCKQLRDNIGHYSYLGDSTFANIVRTYQYTYYFGSDLQAKLDIASMQIPDLDIKISPTRLGLLSGYAGEGLLRLTILNPAIISWMRLL